MWHADTWNLGKKDHKRLLNKGNSHHGHVPNATGTRRQREKGQRYIWCEVVALKGKILQDNHWEISSTKKGLENSLIGLFLFNLRKAHPI